MQLPVSKYFHTLSLIWSTLLLLASSQFRRLRSREEDRNVDVYKVPSRTSRKIILLLVYLNYIQNKMPPDNTRVHRMIQEAHKKGCLLLQSWDSG